MIKKIALLIIVSNISINSQSLYQETNKPSVGLGVKYSINSDATALGISSLIVLHKLFDISLNIDRKSYEAVDFRKISFTPKIILYPFRLLSEYPISLSLTLGYNTINNQSDLLKKYSLKQNESYFLFGGNLYGIIGLSKILNIVPSIEIIRHTGKIETKINNSSNFYFLSNFSVIHIKIAIASKGNKSTFYFEPGILMNKENAEFILNSGVIF